MNISLRAHAPQLLHRLDLMPSRMIPWLDRFPIGLGYMILAVFFFSLMSLFAKLLAGGVPTGQIVMIRGIVGSLLAYWGVRVVNVPIWGMNKRLLIFRGITGFGALMCFFWTLIFLPLAEATILFYTSPCIAAVIAVMVLREHLSFPTIVGFLICILGVICVIQPEIIFRVQQLDLVSVAVGILGAIMAGLAFVAVRKLRETDHPFVIIFYFSFISALCCVPFVIINHAAPSLVEWLLLIGVGVSTHVAQVFLTRSLHREQTSRAMGVSYIQVLFAVGWGIFIFDDFPNLLSISGMVLVAAGSIVAAQRRRAS